MAKFKDADGNEVEIPDADLEAYVAPKVTAAVTAKEAEFGTVKTELEEKLGHANGLLKERAGEFASFRKLSDEAVAKLDVAQKTIYENGLALNAEREKRELLEKTTQENAVKAVIKAKAGSNDKLEKKMTDMWPLLALESNTAEQMEAKAKMILGAISQTEPDLVASVAGFSGSYTPPVKQAKEGESFADTERGTAAAKELGLEFPKAA